MRIPGTVFLVLLSVIAIEAQAPQTAPSLDPTAMAIRNFEAVLRREPNNVAAIAGLADIYRNADQPRKAREYYLRNAELNPLNPTAFYSVGAVDWIIAYDKRSPALPEEQAQFIEEGLRYLDIALAMDPEYDDAMSYTNLLLREKARLSRNELEKNQLTSEADTWFNKALEARKKNQRSRRTTADLSATTAPPPPPPPPPLQTSGVRLSSNTTEASLIFRPALSYPPLAETARIQGAVVLEAVITKDGTVRDARVISGHPLLHKTAVENVMQSRYRAFVLNGEATEVITTISLTYKLN